MGSGSFSFDDAGRHEMGQTAYRPSDPKELLVHRMQHLMSLRGRATKSSDPEIVKHNSKVRTTKQYGSSKRGNVWGERVNRTTEVAAHEAL